jgi:hypothetical protein
LSRRSKSKKQKQETSKPVNYNLFSQKLTFEFLKAHLWAAADILRGSLDPADYKAANYDLVIPEYKIEIPNEKLVECMYLI